MFEDMSGHNRTGELGNSTTHTESGIAPSFLTVPALSNQVAPALNLLTDPNIFAVRMQLFRDAGLLNDGCLGEANGLDELIQLADQQLAKALSFENLCDVLELNITLGRNITNNGCGFRQGSENENEGCFELGLHFSVGNRPTIRYLKDQVTALEKICPGMENFIARIFKSMNAEPWILNPFTVQESFSAYIFEWHQEMFEELEENERDVDFVSSFRHPLILKTIPSLWRSKYTARSWENELNLVLLDKPKRPVALQRQTDPLLEQIRVLGNAIVRDNPRLTKIFNKYPDSRAFQSSNWLLVVAYEPNDFIQQHVDEAYENMIKSGEDEYLGFALSVPKNPLHFIELLRDLKFILTYIDRCLCFCDLVTTE